MTETIIEKKNDNGSIPTVPTFCYECKFSINDEIKVKDENTCLICLTKNLRNNNDNLSKWWMRFMISILIIIIAWVLANNWGASLNDEPNNIFDWVFIFSILFILISFLVFSYFNWLSYRNNKKWDKIFPIFLAKFNYSDNIPKNTN